jgi:hypothetical protein
LIGTFNNQLKPFERKPAIVLPRVLADSGDLLNSSDVSWPEEGG